MKQLTSFYNKLHGIATESPALSNASEQKPEEQKQTLTKSEAAAPQKVPSAEYLCKKCRCILFTDLAIVKHKRPKNPGANKRYGQMKKAAVFQSKRHSVAAPECTCVFIDEQPWMAPQIKNSEATSVAADSEAQAEIIKESLLQYQEGRLYCPKCNNAVGRFSWVGAQCSCGYFSFSFASFSFLFIS